MYTNVEFIFLRNSEMKNKLADNNHYNRAVHLYIRTPFNGLNSTLICLHVYIYFSHSTTTSNEVFP